MLLTIAIALFVIGAIFGLIVLTAVLRDKPTPKPAVVVHGLFVATALVLAIIAYLMGPHSALLATSIVLFIIAALGGFTLLFHDLMHKIIPKWLAVLHPIIAVIALILLIAYVLPGAGA